MHPIVIFRVQIALQEMIQPLFKGGGVKIRAISKSFDINVSKLKLQQKFERRAPYSGIFCDFGSNLEQSDPC